MQLYRRHERKPHQLDLEPSGRTEEVYQALLTEGRQRLTAVPRPTSPPTGGGNRRKRKQRSDEDRSEAPNLRVLS